MVDLIVITAIKIKTIMILEHKQLLADRRIFIVKTLNEIDCIELILHLITFKTLI